MGVGEPDGRGLRPYLVSDRPRCFELFDSNVPRYFAAVERDDFAACLDDPALTYLVIEDVTGQIVACGGFQGDTVRRDVAALCWGMVAGDRHGQGFGTQLLTTRLDRIAALGYASVVIETTQHSRAFFARFGFVERRFVANGFAPGHDLVEMTLTLARVRSENVD